MIPNEVLLGFLQAAHTTTVTLYQVCHVYILHNFFELLYTSSVSTYEVKTVIDMASLKLLCWILINNIFMYNIILDSLIYV